MGEKKKLTTAPTARSRVKTAIGNERAGHRGPPYMPFSVAGRSAATLSPRAIPFLPPPRPPRPTTTQSPPPPSCFVLTVKIS